MKPKRSFLITDNGTDLGVLTTTLVQPELLTFFENIEDHSIGVVPADAPLKKETHDNRKG